MSSVAYLSLGSNVDARANIESGIGALRRAFGEVRLSPVYQTAAFGFDGADFINLVARIETTMSPLELKHVLNEIEDGHDRKRDGPKFSDRTLDIDILLYDDLYLLSPSLELPREEIRIAPYVLKPLADLAPDLLHPACRTTIGQMWSEFEQRHEPMRLIELS
jgi:2-amino-4-hydroxy-6-hydroxymethyldihydropteridine diphosphokinase